MKFNKKSFTRHLLRSAACVTVLAVVYAGFIIVPSYIESKNEGNSRTKQQFIDTLQEYALLTHELDSLAVDSSESYNTAIALTDRLSSINRSFDLAASDLNTIGISQNDYEQLVDHTRRTYLEFLGFREFIDPILAYSPVFDLQQSEAVTTTKEERLSTAISALKSFGESDRKYNAQKWYQLPDGSTVEIPNVVAYTLSATTKSAVQHVLKCFENTTADHINTCKSDYDALKSESIVELSNILQSKANPNSSPQIQAIIDKITAE